MQETLTINGTVSIYHVNAAGIRVKEQHKNLVVTNGKQLITKRLAGDSGEAITKIALGTGSAAAAIGNTALGAAVAPAYATTATYPTTSSVKFSATLAPGDGNGTTFTEMGLMTAAGTLFSRLVLQTPIVKTSEYAIDIEWTIAIQ